MLRLRSTRAVGFDRLYPLSGHWIVLPDASCSTSIEPVTSVSAAASSGSPCARSIARTAYSAGHTASRCILQHKPDEFTGERLTVVRVETGVQWRHWLLGKMAVGVAIIVITLSSTAVAMLYLCICFLQFVLPSVSRTVTISVDAAIALHDSSLASMSEQNKRHLFTMVTDDSDRQAYLTRHLKLKTPVFLANWGKGNVFLHFCIRCFLHRKSHNVCCKLWFCIAGCVRCEGPLRYTARVALSRGRPWLKQWQHTAHRHFHDWGEIREMLRFTYKDPVCTSQ